MPHFYQTIRQWSRAFSHGRTFTPNTRSLGIFSSLYEHSRKNQLQTSKQKHLLHNGKVRWLNGWVKMYTVTL